MAKLLNGAGNMTVTAQQDADLYAVFSGNAPKVLDVGEKMRAEIVTNNKLRIYDGEMISQGRRFHIDAGQYDDFTIENGSQGTTRYDVIGYRFYRDSDGNELAGTFVKKNAGRDPVEEEDIRAGAAESCISMYRVMIEGLTIKKVEALYQLLPSMAEMAVQLEKAAAELKQLGTDTAANRPGYIYSYNTKDHHAGLSFALSQYSVIPRIVIDEQGLDVVPNNKNQENNYKIVDMVPSVETENGIQVWRMVFKIYVDGRIYEKSIRLS